jgi:hypothetical protein
MKTTLTIFTLLLSLSTIYAQKYRLLKVKKKWGLELLVGNDHQIIIPPKYDMSINRNDYYLFYNNEKEQKVNALLVSKKGEELQRFDQISTMESEFIIHKNAKGTHVFSIEQKKNIFENALDITSQKLKINNVSTVYYLIKNSNEIIIRTKDKIIVKREANSAFIDRYNSLIKIGKERFDVYSLEGHLVIQNVTNYDRVRKYFSDLIRYEHGPDSLSVFNKNKLIIPTFKGSIDSKLQSSNRIITQTKEGYQIFNNEGKRLSKSNYQAVFNHYYSDKKADLPNFVKLHNTWSLVNASYEPINEITYEHVEIFNDGFSRSNWIYKVKKSSDATHFEYLDVNGKTILNEEVLVVSQHNENITFLMVSKNKKFGFVNSFGRSEIIYDNIEIPPYDYEINKEAYACKKGKFEVLYIPGKIHKEFFGKGQYDNIENLKFYEDEEASFYWFLHKNKKFQIAFPDERYQLTSYNIAPSLFFDSYELLNFDMDFEYPLLLTSEGKTGLFEGYTLDTIIPMEYSTIILDYDLMDLFSSVKVYQGEKVGLYDLNRKKLKMPVSFDEFTYLDDYLSVENNGKYGVWDTYKNKLILDTIFSQPITYDQLDDFTIRNAKDAKINGQDKLCYQLKDQLYSFDEINKHKYLDLFIVKNSSKIGVMNDSGEDTLIPMEYDLIEKYPLDMDALSLTKNGKHSLYLIDINKFAYTDVDEVIYQSDLSQDFVKKGNKWAIYQFGEAQTPFKFEELNYKAPFYHVKKGGNWGALNIDFEEIIPATHNSEKELIKLIKKM